MSLVFALTLALAGPAGAQLQTCPSALAEFEPIGEDGSCYFVGPEVGTWTEGRTVCGGHGGDLATITSPEENALVSKLLGHCQNNNGCWIGASDEASEGNFVWVDGTPVDYAAWTGGEPNNYCSTEHYVHMQGGGTWNDQAVDGSCSSWGPMNPICEVAARQPAPEVTANPVATAVRFVQEDAFGFAPLDALTYADAFFLEVDFDIPPEETEQSVALEWDGGASDVTVFRTEDDPKLFRSELITLRRPGGDADVEPPGGESDVEP